MNFKKSKTFKVLCVLMLAMVIMAQQPVNVANIPHVIVDTAPSTAVTNAGTFATQSTLQTQTDTVMVGGVNIKEINAVAPLMGNGTTGTGSLRVTVASDNTAFAVNSTLSAETTKIIGETIPVSTATTTDTLLRCNLISAASTNATNCKNAGGNIYGFRFVNTTTTIYYLRMYNLTTSPTCSSATGFVETIPIPPAAASGGAGGIVAMEPNGEGYSTGIGFCFTGGSSSTDNTNAAIGVLGSILYK